MPGLYRHAIQEFWMLLPRPYRFLAAAYELVCIGWLLQSLNDCVVTTFALRSQFRRVNRVLFVLRVICYHFEPPQKLKRA